MVKKTLCYRGSLNDSRRGEFLHARISVWPVSTYRSISDSAVHFTWQADTGDTDRSWYAFSICVEGNSLKDIRAKVKVARRVLTREMQYGTQPEHILDRLEKIAIEVVYDGRIGGCVPLGEVLPAEIKAWRDDYQKMNRPHCTVGCLAEVERVAQQELLLKLAGNPSYQEYMIRWLEARQPVICLDDRRPDVTPAMERLALNKEG